MRALDAIRKGGINTKLVRVFVLQVLAISLATVLGVYAAAVVVENVLVREALNGEAEHFWSQRRANPMHPLPDTNNLTGYIAVSGDYSNVPEWLRDLQTGFHRVDRADENNPIVYVSDNANARLFLIFDEMQVSALAFYFGIAPLTGVLLLIYLLTWFGYVMSRRAVSTIVRLAEAVRHFDFASGKMRDLDIRTFANTNDNEVLALVNAFEQFGERLEAFVHRERNFTRNASHELRTPLAVLKANLELIQRFPDSDRRDVILDRMARTVRDMESLVETLLILARESQSKLSWTSVVINDLLHEQLGQVNKAMPNPNLQTDIEAECLLEVDAPERVLAIIFTNLLRNAFSYTDTGRVTVQIQSDGVVIRDTGCGMSEADLERAFEPFYRGHDRSNEGYGLGLAIVKRLCGRFGWPLEADSELGAGTAVRVLFPRGRAKPFTGRDGDE